MYLGIDDTDSVNSMCTTYLATELLRGMKRFNLDVIRYPRLVRLNPNIPWKTRGNGAICIRFGKGSGKKGLIAEINGVKYFCYERENNNRTYNYKNFFEYATNIIEKYARFADDNTNPGFVLLRNKPKSKLYWNAVRGIVKLKYVKGMLEKSNALYKGYKNERGLIGATAAIAWRPKDKTYEIMTYRDKKKWGRKRYVDTKSVIGMDMKFSHTFNNYDYDNRKVVIAPHSKCPVLFGIRGEKPDLIDAMKAVKSEKIFRWVLFETNQATDDHLVKKTISNIIPYDSVIISGKVISNPKTISGGHVIFRFADKTGEMDCAAYEPTKNFRNIVRELRSGDEITVFGSVRKKPITINIEKIRVDGLSAVYEKFIPVCKCGKKMKSIGKNKGYRCKKCSWKIKAPILKKIDRNIKRGFYEVPACARRHLSKPLKRLNSAT